MKEGVFSSTPWFLDSYYASGGGSTIYQPLFKEINGAL